jgi:hypothetical protein
MAIFCADPAGLILNYKFGVLVLGEFACPSDRVSLPIV